MMVLGVLVWLAGVISCNLDYIGWWGFVYLGVCVKQMRNGIHGYLGVYLKPKPGSATAYLSRIFRGLERQFDQGQIKKKWQDFGLRRERSAFSYFKII